MAMNRVNQERLLYENQLRIYRDQLASLKDPNAPEQAAERKRRQVGRTRTTKSRNTKTRSPRRGNAIRKTIRMCSGW